LDISKMWSRIDSAGLHLPGDQLTDVPIEDSWIPDEIHRQEGNDDLQVVNSDEVFHRFYHRVLSAFASYPGSTAVHRYYALKYVLGAFRTLLRQPYYRHSAERTKNVQSTLAPLTARFFGI
jgi:hypothetical protein